MAHFAELDEYNRVKRILVACNTDVANNGGEQSVEAAKHFETVVPLSPGAIRYVQNSYNNNFSFKKLASLICFFKSARFSAYFITKR